MPSINVSEADFTAVAGAAKDAWEAGKKDEAHRLDKVARKMNAALSNLGVGSWFRPAPISWKDVPSTLPGE